MKDAFLTCSQLCRVVASMHEPEKRLKAALLGFGVLSDPHQLRYVLEVLEPSQAVVFKKSIGGLK